MPPKSSGNDLTLKPPDTGVTVRMYYTGFGECFLLAFRSEEEKPFYLLVDCGVHDKYPGGRERMMLIVEDIVKATNNRLNVVAVTHEHSDHLYGFKYGEKCFEKIAIDELWFAWTEDPENTLANELKHQYGNEIAALRTLIAQLKSAGNPLGDRLELVTGFDLSNDIGIRGNKDILSALRGWTIKKLERSKDYRTPEEAPFVLPGVRGVKVYVLGPPQDEELIKKLIDPKEMYSELSLLNEETAFIAAILATTGETLGVDSELLRRSVPFDAKLGIPQRSAENHAKYGKFFKEFYGFNLAQKDDESWRRIDTDWLGVADQLALALNNLTNNTSLVFALELTETQPRKVLMFTGDAQVGNWLSWQKLEWTGEDGERVKGSDLLKRTVFYKCGHHGSINATLREKGLEQMGSDELISMISVDGDWAKSIRWRHPDEAIERRLREKTHGRVLRSDKIPDDDDLAKPEEATEEEWQAFLQNLEWDRGPNKLWIQYTVK